MGLSIIIFFAIKAFFSLGDLHAEVVPRGIFFETSHLLEIEDPSGIDIDPLTGDLFIVSDERNKGVYRVTKEGDIVSKLSYRGDDLEGLTVDPYNRLIWVIEERKRKIVKLDFDGHILDQHSLDIPQNRQNDGIEGITKDLYNRVFYVVNQRNPQQFLKLDHNYKVLVHLKEQELEHLNLRDLSGLYYHHEMKKLWIVSSRSKEVIIVEPETFKVLQRFKVDISKPEGLAVSVDSDRLYVVCDDENKLYVFTIEF